MLIETLMGPRGAQLLADVMTVGAIVTFIYGLVKLAYQRVTGRALPRSVVTNVLDVAVEVFSNVWGMLNRAGRLQGLPSIFAPPSPPSDAVPPRPEAPPPPIPPANNQRGTVRVGLMLSICAAILVATVTGAALYGCPNWNRPACPRPGVRTCVSDQPHLCSPTGELTPIGDEPCGAQQRVCALDDAGVAYCARGAADGGAQ